MKITLQNLINRIKSNERYIEKHPESKEMLERKIAESKELIVQCVLQNDGNSLLDDIVLK